MTDTIGHTLDGREAEAGQTIWEVAQGRGLKIPHPCHKPEKGCRPDGNWREGAGVCPYCGVGCQISFKVRDKYSLFPAFSQIDCAGIPGRDPRPDP